MTSSELCEYLDWDTAFFGRRIAQAIPQVLTPETVHLLLTWCEAHRIECLYFLASSQDQTTIGLAQKHEFDFVDIRMLLQRALSLDLVQAPISEAIRPCKQEDIQSLRAIARVSYHDSRFYHDSHFPRTQCDALYETWIEKSCQGYADSVWVAEEHGRAIGFITCHLADVTGTIGLTGVSASAQGSGIGGQLVSQALRWFVEHGVSTVQTVTQGRNVKAQRLYQRCGFLTASVTLWYHRWFSRMDSAE